MVGRTISGVSSGSRSSQESVQVLADEALARRLQAEHAEVIADVARRKREQEALDREIARRLFHEDVRLEDARSISESADESLAERLHNGEIQSEISDTFLASLVAEDAMSDAARARADSDLARTLLEEEEHLVSAAPEGSDRAPENRRRDSSVPTGPSVTEEICCYPPVAMMIGSLGGGCIVNTVVGTSLGFIGAAMGAVAGLAAGQVAEAEWTDPVAPHVPVFSLSFAQLVVRRMQEGWNDNRHFEDDGYDDDEEDEQPARGVDSRAIEGLTAVAAYTAPSGKPAEGEAEEEGKCMICFEEFQTGEQVRSLPCFHRYHRNCIDQWLRRSTNCPICKHEITD